MIHDLCPLIVGWTFPEAARWGFEKFFSEDVLDSDVAISVSHSTKADAAWLCPMPQDRIKVAHSGMSLCLREHRHRGKVRRSTRIGLAVSTVEPRKNAGFLLDWFHATTVLPADAELWWVGRMGWLTSRKELRKLTRPAGRTPGPVPRERLRRGALPALPARGVVDLPVGLRGVRLPGRRLAPPRDARHHEPE